MNLTEKEIAYRRACTYLKGLIVGYGMRWGMKWESKREPSEDFQAGMNQLTSFINTAHIIYNRLRHNRPHLNSINSDTEYLNRDPRTERWIKERVSDHIDYDIWENE